MSTKIAVLLFGLVFLAAVSADELTLNPDHPQSYVVEEGDTLWDVSARFLAEPWRWPELWEANPQVEDPHLIYPGNQLNLAWKDGRPYLSVGGRYPGDRRIKLSPQIRETVHEQAIDPIPLDAIRQFLSRPRVLSAGELASSAYIAASEDQHVVNGAGARVYVRGLSAADGDRFTILRGTKVYRDPDSGAVLGHEALHIGDAVVERAGEPAIVYIVRANREVLNGDRLLTEIDEPTPRYFPRAPGQGVDGRIISVIDGVSEIGQHQVVVLNRGSTAGMERGHVLAINRAGSVVRDRHAGTDPYRDTSVKTNALARFFGAIADAYGTENDQPGELTQLPEERTGELMIFRVFDQVSYALVMDINRPVHINDRVVNP